MKPQPHVNRDGNYIVTLKVDLTLDPAMFADNPSRADLTGSVVDQMLRIDGVLRAVEDFID